MSSKSLIETLKPKGHLEIIKTYLDGTKEVVFSDHNIITVGMGINLAELFGQLDGTKDISRHQIRYFQLGTAGSLVYAVSSITQLDTAFVESNYGDTQMGLSQHYNTDGSGGTTLQHFVELSNESITKVSSDQVTYVIDLDTDTGNGVSVSEIGLYADDPFGLGDGGGTKASLLCAYRYFGAISKSSTFALTFKWTITF